VCRSGVFRLKELVVVVHDSVPVLVV
jgi:hypothetical protein